MAVEGLGCCHISPTQPVIQRCTSNLNSRTFDNGKEFTEHEAIAKALGADCYFADPYSSWQRGLNENTNGLLRQHFRKGKSLAAVTDKEVEFAVNRLNTRPRKCSDWQIETLRDDPRPPSAEKLATQERYHLRQGDYRILYLYAVAEAEAVIEVVKAGHRHDAYSAP